MAKQKKDKTAELYTEQLKAGKMPGFTQEDIDSMIGGLVEDSDADDNNNDNIDNDGTVVDNNSTDNINTDNIDTDEIKTDVVKVPETIEPNHTTEDQRIEQLEHKLKVLQGMYNSEKDSLGKQLDIYVTQNKLLNDVISNIKKVESNEQGATNGNKPLTQIPVTVQSESQAPAPINIKAVVSEADIDEYGEPMIEVMSKIAKAYAGNAPQPIDLSPVVNEINSIRADIEDIKNSMANTISEIAQPKINTFTQQLTELIPEWEEINRTTSWLNWLKGEYNDTGFTRNEVLQNNHKRLNAKVVASIFTDYLNETMPNFKDKVEVAEKPDKTAEVPIMPESPAPNKVEQKRPVVDIVSDMIAPSHSTATTVPLNPTSKPIMKQSELNLKTEQMGRNEITYPQYEKYYNQVRQAIAEGRFVMDVKSTND